MTLQCIGGSLMPFVCIVVGLFAMDSRWSSIGRELQGNLRAEDRFGPLCTIGVEYM